MTKSKGNSENNSILGTLDWMENFEKEKKTQKKLVLLEICSTNM